MDKNQHREQIVHERYQILHLIERTLDAPMVVLGFVWLVLLIVDLTKGLSPMLDTASNTIWIIFIVNFVLEFSIAPHKRVYLKQNWLTAIALVVPALRIFRVLRLVRFLKATRSMRSLQMVRLLSSVRRGMQSLGAFMGRRGFGYVLALTVIVTMLGAAGMYAFEKDVTVDGAPHSYGSALWWTAMIMTTMGSQYWPQTAEGRVLCLLLAIYAFAVFGYVTATIASFFVTSDASAQKREDSSKAA